MNRLSARVFHRPCIPILRTNVVNPKLPLPYRFSPSVNYTPLLAQISTQRLGSTTELGKPLTILEKLQAKSNTANPDTTGFIAVGGNEGLLFFDSL